MTRKTKTKWGGTRRNQTGRPGLPAAEKLIYRSAGLLPAEWLKLERIAHRHGLSVNAALRRAVKEFAE